MRTRLLLLVPAVCLVVLGVHVGPAFASCATPPGSLRERLQASEIVFVGRVVATEAGGSVANVAVESVWRGDVDGNVVVSGGEGAPGTITSVDASYQAGRRYLFVPWRGTGQRFRDNSCTDTRLWRARYAALRPATAVDVTTDPPPATTPPPADGDDVATGVGQNRPPVLLVVTALAALMAIAAVAAVASRRRTRS